MINTDQDYPLDVMPANLNAEQAVLGALLIDSAAIDDVSALLRPSDFYRERHEWIYQAILTIHERNEPIDFVTIVDEIDKSNHLEQIGGSSYITELLSSTPTAMYATHYATIVKRSAMQRRLIAAAGKIAEIAYDSNFDISKSVDKAEQLVLSVGEDRINHDIESINQILPDVITQIDILSNSTDQFSGVSTGFNILDKMLGGMQKSDLIIIAARPGMGKSSLGLTIAHNIFKKSGLKTAIFSLEMSSEQVAQRLLSIESGISSHRLRIGQIEPDEWTNLVQAAGVLSEDRIFVDDTPGISVMDIRAKARRLHASENIDLIMIDYMQLMSGGNEENRQQEISFISRSLKELAKELNIPVLALSQLNRSVESRTDNKPMLSDLRESGAIEQDADVVIFIYREDYYNEETDRQNIADLIIAKHRHGETGTIQLFFRKELTQFCDVEIKHVEFNQNG